ncbi:MAG: tetratricopeptide repeat protein [Deltaproteobacteria bacterium]|nr:tetratricopeptide repeat protein [Deltaproteobacteria bacterium]
MRIDCDQCSAAFTIDDGLISDRGVRAQCPKCGHQKVVKKLAAADSGVAAPTVPGPFAPPAPANPFAAGGAAPSPFAPPAAPAAANPFAGLGAPSSPSPSANPFGAPAANPFGAPPAAANPFGAPPAAASAPSNPFGAPAPVAAPSNPFGAPAAANPFGGAPAASPFGGGAAPAANPFGAAASPFGAAPANPFGAQNGGAAPANPFGGAAGNPFGGGGAAPAANPFGGAASGGDPFAKAPAPANDPFARPSSSPPANDPFARTAAPANDPFAPKAGATDPFGNKPAGASDPFGAKATAPNDPFAPKPTGGGGAGDPFSNLGSAGGAASSPFGGPATGSADAFGRKETGTGSSSSSLGDPFAKGPGEASDPFAKVPGDTGNGSSSSSSSALQVTSGQWTLKSGSGEEVLDLAELRDRVKAGSVKADDKAGPVGDPLKAIKDWPLLAVALPGKKDEKSKVAGARASGGLSIPRPALYAIVAVVALGGGGAIIAKLKPELFEIKSEAGVNPLRRARPLWQRQFPEVDGTAQEHLVEGRKQMRLDTAAGYRKADDELRQALLLDVGNLAAIAAWAENFAQLPTVRADLEGSTLAQEGLDYALKRDPENVELLRGQAALKLALGDVDDAQRLLMKAKKNAPGDVDTLVILARSNLERNPTDALAIVQREVRAKNPDLKVAYVIEGAAQRRLGAFKEAREMLEARLVSDPSNVGALKEIAKLELDLGHADAAVRALTKLIDAEDKDVEAHLLRAKINYQIKGGSEGLKAADAQLNEVLAKHEGAAGDLLLSVLAHAAYVKTQLGEVDAAIALGERARATDAGYPSALFVLGRAYAQKGDLDNAKKTLEQAVRATEQRDQFFEPLVRSELAAVQARAGDEANAIRNNEKVIDYDPRNTRAHFGLAAIYVKNLKFTQAMTIMRRALSNDPAWDRDRLLPTDFPTPRSDLSAFADAFRDAKTPKDDESLLSLKYSSEGMIRYHAGEHDKAEQLFGLALKEDRYNHAALLYLSVMNMGDGQYAEPKRRLKLAVDTTAASHPVTRLYLARAELLTGDDDAARTRLTDLVETEPTLVQARYSLAMVLRKQKLEAQATTELKSVVRQDPDYLPAKQALAEKL